MGRLAGDHERLLYEFNLDAVVPAGHASEGLLLLWWVSKIVRALNFPHRLPHSNGWLDAASDESLPPLSIFSG